MRIVCIVVRNAVTLAKTLPIEVNDLSVMGFGNIYTVLEACLNVIDEPKLYSMQSCDVPVFLCIFFVFSLFFPFTPKTFILFG